MANILHPEAKHIIIKLSTYFLPQEMAYCHGNTIPKDKVTPTSTVRRVYSVTRECGNVRVLELKKA
jgi:hypothetical protein